MKWILRGVLASAIIVGFVLCLTDIYWALALGLALLALWFLVAWFGHETRPVTVDE